MADESNCENKQCLGMSSKTHEDIVIKLTRIESGQHHLFESLSSINKAIAKISVQEERIITLKARVDAAWLKIDTMKEAHDKCPIKNLQTQVGWIWIFLSGLALGLALMFIGGLVGG
jgi:hypothetical protein